MNIIFVPKKKILTPPFFFPKAFLYFYSKELRRIMKCIVLSTPYIIDLIFFYILITSIWTLVGYKIISNLEGEVAYDEYLNNFDDYPRALNAMYVLISFDGYPDIMLPSLSKKKKKKNETKQNKTRKLWKKLLVK